MSFFFCLVPPRRSSSPLFPYTTLFRSERGARAVEHALPERADLGRVLADEQRRELLAHDRHQRRAAAAAPDRGLGLDRKSTRLNSSHLGISYAVFCLKKKTTTHSKTHQ